MPEKPRCSLWRGAQWFPALAAIEGVSGRREPAESVLEFEASKYPARRGQRSQRDARVAAARETQSGVPIWRLHRIWRTSERRRSHQGNGAGARAAPASERRRTPPLHCVPRPAVRTTRRGDHRRRRWQASGWREQTRALHVHLVVGRRVLLHRIMLRVGLLGVQHGRSCPSISDLSACMRHRPRLAPHALYSPACPLQPRAQLASAQQRTS